MPNNALLAIVLLAGFVFINFFKVLSFRAKRLDGYRLLMESACFGVLVLVPGRLLTVFLKSYTQLADWWHSSVTVEPYAGTVAACLPLSYAIAKLANLFVSENSARARAIELHGNIQLKILQAAMENELPVLITLNNTWIMHSPRPWRVRPPRTNHLEPLRILL